MGGWEICIQQCNRPSLVLSLEIVMKWVGLWHSILCCLEQWSGLAPFPCASVRKTCPDDQSLWFLETDIFVGGVIQTRLYWNIISTCLFRCKPVGQWPCQCVTKSTYLKGSERWRKLCMCNAHCAFQDSSSHQRPFPHCLQFGQVVGEYRCRTSFTPYQRRECPPSPPSALGLNQYIHKLRSYASHR